MTVARWRSRFRVLGVDGLRREAPRLGSPPRVPEKVEREILRKTLFDRPPTASRWSTRSLARAVGVSHSTVRRVWKSHNVLPPRSRVAAIARHSRFRPRSIDVLGVYVNPPRRAVALSLADASSRETPGVPDVSRASGPQSATFGRAWMGDLFSTLNLLDKRPPKGSAQRLIDPEFLSFLGRLWTRRRGGERVHVLAVSSATPSLLPLDRWLRRHPEFSAEIKAPDTTLRALVSEWFQSVPTGRPAGVAPESLPRLRTAVERWMREPNETPRPFAWTRRRASGARKNAVH